MKKLINYFFESEQEFEYYRKEMNLDNILVLSLFALIILIVF